MLQLIAQQRHPHFLDAMKGFPGSSSSDLYIMLWWSDPAPKILEVQHHFEKCVVKRSDWWVVNILCHDFVFFTFRPGPILLHCLSVSVSSLHACTAVLNLSSIFKWNLCNILNDMTVILVLSISILMKLKLYKLNYIQYRVHRTQSSIRSGLYIGHHDSRGYQALWLANWNS